MINVDAADGPIPTSLAPSPLPATAKQTKRNPDLKGEEEPEPQADQARRYVEPPQPIREDTLPVNTTGKPIYIVMRIMPALVPIPRMSR